MEGQNVQDVSGRIRDELANGKPRYEVLQGLVDEGRNRKETELLIRQEEERRYHAYTAKRRVDERRMPQVRTGTKDMVAGGLTCITGVLVTVFTYAAASGGGMYVVAWGAILFGGIRFIRGMVKASKGGSPERIAESEKSRPFEF